MFAYLQYSKFFICLENIHERRNRTIHSVASKVYLVLFRFVGCLSLSPSKNANVHWPTGLAAKGDDPFWFRSGNFWEDQCFPEIVMGWLSEPDIP
jgi:hypothetical protein